MEKRISVQQFACVFVFVPYLSGLQSACAVIVLYCQLLSVWLYQILSINGTIFGGKKALNMKCVF
jgi:hypothetical protein